MSRRRMAGVAVLAVLGLALAPRAFATTFAGDETYVLPAGQSVTGNLYAFGNTVRIEGRVDGDLISGGTKVEVASGGVIEGDLMAGGQSVVIQGTVNGDVRAAGFMVQAEPGARIGGELVAAGYSVGIGEGATIGGDVAVGGAQGIVDGTVEGDLRFGGAGLDIQGAVNGDVDAAVDAPGTAAPPTWWTMFMPDAPALPRNVPMGLTLGDGARVGGALRYTSPAASTVREDAVSGGVSFTEAATQPATSAPEAEAAPPPPPPTAADRALDWLGGMFKSFVSLAIIGLFLAWLTPRLLGSAHGILAAQPAPSAGWGCLTLIAAAAGVLMLLVAMVLGLIIVGTINLDPLVGPILSASFLGFALLTFGTILLGWIGRVVVSIWVGRWLLGRLAPAQGENRYVVVLVGALVFAILTALPYIGGILDLVGMALGLGALVTYAWPLVRSGLMPAAAPAAAA